MKRRPPRSTLFPYTPLFRSADLVDLLEPAHDAALQVQLVGDPQIEVCVERFVVRLERPRGRAAVQRLQHWGFDLEVAARVEEPAHIAHHARAQAEDLPHLGVYREVGVALAGPQLGVRQLAVPHPARVLFAERQRPQRLRQQRQPLDPHGDLPRLGAEQGPLHPDHVPQVEQLHDLILLGAEGVDLEVDLDPAAGVLQMPEGRLAHRAQQHEPPRQPVHRRVALAESLERRAGGAGALEPVREPRHAAPNQLGELFAARGLDEARHAALLPNCFKYASMKGSRSTSITICTSVTFSSVRWSFTMVYGWNT